MCGYILGSRGVTFCFGSKQHIKVASPALSENFSTKCVPARPIHLGHLSRDCDMYCCLSKYFSNTTRVPTSLDLDVMCLKCLQIISADDKNCC